MMLSLKALARLHSLRPAHSLHFRVRGWFGDEKPTELGSGEAVGQSQGRAPQQSDPEFDEEEKELIEKHIPDETWNKFLKLKTDYNPQKELIVHRRNYNNSKEKLRAAILFEDLLRTQLKICVYDTRKKPWMWEIFKIVYAYFITFGLYWSWKELVRRNPSERMLVERTTWGKAIYYTMAFLSALLLLTWTYKYIMWLSRHVEKVVYDTEKEEFTFIKRSLIGRQRPFVFSRYKIMYTENRLLNSKGINYFEIDTKEQLSLVYRYSWLRQDLFSHLISQRIKV